MSRQSAVLFAVGLGLGLGGGYLAGIKGVFTPTRPRFPIPKEWVLEKEMKLESDFSGLDERQRFMVLRLLNRTPCGCGCKHESLAVCLKANKRCATAPDLAKKAIAMIREEKSPVDVRKAIDPEGDKDAETAPQKIEVAAWSPFLGPPTAKVTIVAFSDFQCPFCSRAVPELKKVEAAYPSDVRIVFRHQPLSFHQNAMGAAEAAMAAHAQGKFWPMHDRLFAHQDELDRASLEKHAKAIGLQMGKFKEALDKHQFAPQIEADKKRGMEVGADGTPTFFINGRPLQGAQPFEDFKKVIDEERARADKLLGEGVAPAKLYETILSKIDEVPPKPAPTCQ